MDLKKQVYLFAKGETRGNASMKNILGGKGANLAEMTNLGLPVPPGFTIATPACRDFYDRGQKLSDDIRSQVEEALLKIERKMDKKFGDPSNPLLVSVRSGARVSMPGMMDTILNLGLNDETVQGLARSSDNERFAWDSYRRFIQMYSNVVFGMNISLLEMSLEDMKEDKGYRKDGDLKASDFKELVTQFKDQIVQTTGKSFPTDPREQLWGAIEAVFTSWNNDRAVTYRKLNSIPHHWGTAVNVQVMVFGNRGEDSGTGVAFTRDPSTGEKTFFGEYLMNAQGEDVVAGTRTPQPLTKAATKGTELISLEESYPKVFKELVNIHEKLENHYRDMQDIEFTIEKGQLWMLQTRSGKRTARASLKIAMDMIDEKLIDEKEALLRIDPLSLDQLLHPTLDPQGERTLLTRGLPASPGGVSGKVVFSSQDASLMSEKGEKVILVRIETSPEDIEGMVASQGILTSRGGMTSHAAVVARGMGKCCVAGCGDINVNEPEKEFRANGYVIKAGELITLDGSTGEVFLGKVKTLPPRVDGPFERVMKLANKFKKIGVRANADNPKDAKTALEFGAEGLGLCRTEHMFFAPERIDWVRRMILAENREQREEALRELLPMQQQDFYEILKIMGERPVTIRLLDPPLHEFLPHTDEEAKELSQRLEVPFSELRNKIRILHEFNPMLGHRGCRLGITYPEVYGMQARAIAQATTQLIKEGQKLVPEIMIPLVGEAKELSLLRDFVIKTVETVKEKEQVNFKYLIGTMIELPRAAVTADEVAQFADFFSFGTNDLTQTTLGLSRDDSTRFLNTYVSGGIYSHDPFVSLDQKGVGKLVQMGIDLGRGKNPKLKIGICGEHGGDPMSIGFFTSLGMDYVSCSPFRLPAARLAAAQATLHLEKTPSP